MCSKKNMLLHQWNSYDFSLIENRLIYNNKIQENIKDEIESINNDIEDLEIKLNKEDDSTERKDIENKIKELKAEKARLKAFKILSLKDTQKSPLLIAGITNTLSNLENRINKEEDSKKRKNLEKRKRECLKNLGEINKEIKNEEDLRYAFNEWNLYKNALTRLDSEEMDYQDLSSIMESKLGSFLEEEDVIKMTKAIEKMKVADNILSTINKIPLKKLEEIAEKEWDTKYVPQAKKAIKAAKKIGRKDLVKQIIQELENKSAKENWIHKRTIELERTKQPKLKEKVSEKTIEKAKSILIEAREIRINVIVEFITSKVNNAKKVVSEIDKDKSLNISSEEIDGINFEIDEFQKKLEVTRDFDELKTLLRRINLAEEQIKNLKKSIIKTNDTEKLKSDVRSKFEKLRGLTSVNSENEDRYNKAIIELEERERNRINKIPKNKRTKYDVLGKSQIYKNNRAKIDAFFGKDTRTQELIRIEGKRLKNIDDLSPEELTQIDRDFDALIYKRRPRAEGAINKVQQGEKLDIAEKAKSAINKLRYITDVNGIKTVLQDEALGFKDNVKFVSDSEFRNYKYKDGKEYDLTKHTGGHMVFFERGEDWEIVINEEALGNPNQTKKVQGQITHELLHLQFEKEEGLSNKWVSGFKNNKYWPEIRNTYLNSFPDKKPPQIPPNVNEWGKEDWKDEDIVNEIFAMQNDIGKKEIKNNKSPKTKLNNALFASKLLPNLLGTNKEQEPETKVHGAEEGFDDFMGSEDSESNRESGSPIEIESTSQSAQENELNIKRLGQEIDDYLESDYISYIPDGSTILNGMKKYNNETNDLNEDLDKTNDSFVGEMVQNRITQLSDDLKKIKEEIEKVAKSRPNDDMGYFRNLWNSTTMLSLDDFIQMGSDFKEWWERRHKRKTANNAAVIGSSLFDKMRIPIIGEFGSESNARQQKAEAEEVSEWQSRIENKDAVELIDRLNVMAKEADPNKDELKAVLRVLADKGRINWRNPALWTILSKLQSSASLSPNDKILLDNPTILRQRLHSALGDIYDLDEFPSLDSKNTSSYESRKKEYQDLYDSMQGQLDNRLDELLQQHRMGKEADPMEYEAIIEYAVLNGKSNAENVMFHLIIGMAYGLLSPDRGTHLDKHLNSFPAFEYLMNMGFVPTRQNFHNLCTNVFEKEYIAGKYNRDGKSEFKNFFWTVIQNNELVKQRVEKSTSERGWDHDWSRSIAPNGGSDTANRFLRGRSGQKETKSTAVQNAYTGCLQWFEENAKKGANYLEQNLATHISWSAMAGGIMESVAYKNETIYTRKEALSSNKVARESGESNHPNVSAEKNRQRIQEFLMIFDETFFSLIVDKQKADAEEGDKESINLTNEIKAHLNNTYGSNEKTQTITNSIAKLDDVFQNMDAIVNIIMEERKDRIPLAIQLLLDKDGKVKPL